MAKSLEVDQQWLDRIAEQVGGLQYGQVTITVHDGRIVQIDRTERTRYDAPSRKGQQPEAGVPSGNEAKAAKPRDKQYESESLRAVQ